MRIIKFAILMLGFLTLPFQIGHLKAQEWSTDDTAPEPEKPALLQQLEKTGTQVFYMGVFEDIQGWVIVQNGVPTYFYQQPGTKALMQGILYDETGDNVTSQQLQKLQFRQGDIFAELIKPIENQKNTQGVSGQNSSLGQAAQNTQRQTNMAAIDPSSPSQRLFQSFEAAGWSALGHNGAPAIYTVIDPDCPHCKEMIRQMRPLIEAKRLQLRIIPIGFNDVSKRVGALMLASADPMSVIFGYIDGELKPGAINENISTSAIDNNIALVRRWELDATPFSIYRSQAGQVKLLRGIPNDIGALLADVARN